LAHLLCELLVRLQAVGLATENSYEFPVTQGELGDTLGISTVHVNRMLKQLRKDGLLTLQRHRLTILDLERLKEFAGFNSNYLHLTRSLRDGSEDDGSSDAATRTNRGEAKYG
jgi:hypothetical protein